MKLVQFLKTALLGYRYQIVYGLLISLFILCPKQSVAQQTISYEYDASGNRISRRILVLPQQLSKSNSDKIEPLTDQLGERQIKVYPNPTKGHLVIEIQGGNPKEAQTLQLFDSHGKQLIGTNLQTGQNSIDLSSYPASWYILRITSGNDNKEYKIIKE